MGPLIIVKFKEQIGKSNFFKFSEPIDDICHFCQIIPKREGEKWEEDRCKQCNLHLKIGSKLPKADFITYIYGKHDFVTSKNMDVVKIPFEDFGVTVFIANKTEMKRILDTQEDKKIAVYRINPEYSKDKGLDFTVL